MKKNSLLKIINPIIGLLMLNQIITGMLGFKLPHEAFEIFHKGGGFILAGLVVVHLLLNWSWIKANYLRGPATTK
jgi:hypothetical protein